MATVRAAFPFIEVFIDTSQLAPVAQRAPGVIAIVGATGGAGTAPANVPLVVDTVADAATLFADATAGTVTPNRALRIAAAGAPAGPAAVEDLRRQDRG